MKLINYIKNTLSRLYLSLKRFPLTILMATLTFIMLICISEINTTQVTEDTLYKVALILALGIPLSLCIKLFFEKRDEEDSYRLIIGYLCGGLLLILYYFLLLNNINDMVTITRYIAVSLALYLGFLFIPYLLKKEQFEMYIITLSTNFFITVIYSIVLFLGLSAILFTIDKLLGITIKDDL